MCICVCEYVYMSHHSSHFIPNMAKPVLIFAILILSHICSSSATNYIVGDSSGWDISTDLDTWLVGKRFNVGDVLVFQYSSFHSVSEVTKENFEGCNRSNVLDSSKNGNTTFPLTKPGERYFVCGNRLHCLGGMKLHVNVGNDIAASPAAAPEAEAGAFFPSSKSNNPSVVPSFALSNHVGLDSLVILTLALLSLAFALVYY